MEGVPNGAAVVHAVFLAFVWTVIATPVLMLAIWLVENGDSPFRIPSAYARSAGSLLAVHTVLALVPQILNCLPPAALVLYLVVIRTAFQESLLRVVYWLLAFLGIMSTGVLLLMFLLGRYGLGVL